MDPDHPCDANQRLVKGVGYDTDSCACVPGSVPDARGFGCNLCGANEIAAGDKCACIEGYARTTEKGPCEMSSVGAACTADTDCAAPFPYCATDDGERYCSVQSCTATSCPTGYACEEAGGATYCKKLPEGLGKPCTTDADCASGEAKSCDTMVSHTCILTGCATKQITCPGFYACCDLGAFVPGFSLCAPPDQLTADGQCSFDMKVTP